MMAEIDNAPALWAHKIPVPDKNSHKYARGHAVLLGGSLMTGAARMAAEAAMRIGAGVCTIVADPAAADVYRAGAPHILYEPLGSLSRFAAEHLADPRRNAVLIGPGAGRADDRGLRHAVLETLVTRKALVLDADALNVFEGQTADFFNALHENVVLTPHEGEFARLFGPLSGHRAQDAAAAARKTEAILLLKGAETVIAHPDGRVVVNRHASPFLATAGAGDVLAGMILGLLAQKMDPFDAACAASWIHGEAALRIGPGLVAPDLIAEIPEILRELT